MRTLFFRIKGSLAAGLQALGLTGALPDGRTGDSYTGSLTVTGGSGAFSVSVVSGSLPPGLTIAINSNTITISGTPS